MQLFYRLETLVSFRKKKLANAKDDIPNEDSQDSAFLFFVIQELTSRRFLMKKQNKDHPNKYLFFWHSGPHLMPLKYATLTYIRAS